MSQLRSRAASCVAVLPQASAPMELHTKTGPVYLQPHKAGKKWKPVWLSLFAPSSSGVGRLEIQDVGGGDSGTRRQQLPHGDRKVVRLSELISVLRLPPNAEACPKENMSAFCVETHERTMVFAAAKDECVDWVEKLCQSTFQRGGASRSTQLRMEENQIYASADEVQGSPFWVAVQRTEAAARCGLQGSYWLHVGPEALQLRAQQDDVVGEWPYKLLRRYGRDGMALTIEAGRRCGSGPGTFVFETQQAESVFLLIQSTIKSKTSKVTLSQNPEAERGPASKARSPLPRTPDASGASSPWENRAKVQGKMCSSLEDVGGDSAGSEPVAAHPAPITLMPLPSVPTLNRPSPRPDPDVVHASASDTPQPKALYVDPACVLPLKPPAQHPRFSIDHPDSGYAEVYDKISPVQSKRGKADEPIYAEPLHKKEDAHTGETRSDPFAHLYAQVCKTGRAPSPAPPGGTAPSVAASAPPQPPHPDPPLDDVIYESLGVI
ncbi:docking protein 2 isoform X2 [Betta splendens]|uniref:Docking protein 2 isoform X2 n=1 Tax=Betta splendens TaxID=158456 RepID=A0A6P7LZ15_BETSP|nr:docking protein 2 isoform X2 [Betta splendens]